MASNSSFAQLDALKADARQVGLVLCPVAELQKVVLHFSNGVRIPLTLEPADRTPKPIPPSPPANNDFTPTASQWKMIKAISQAGKASKKALVNAAGDTVYRRGRGGLDELCRQEVAQAVPGGFELTDLGNALLVEQSEND